MENLYEQNPNWSKTMVRVLAKAMDIKSTKVYKWLWERNKKNKNP